MTSLPVTMFHITTLFNKMIPKKLCICLIILLFVVNTFSLQVLPEEEANSASRVTTVNKNVDSPGNYEDVSTVFKKL